MAFISDIGQLRSAGLSSVHVSEKYKGEKKRIL